MNEFFQHLFSKGREIFLFPFFPAHKDVGFDLFSETKRRKIGDQKTTGEDIILPLMPLERRTGAQAVSGDKRISDGEVE